jgi:hypothetical protein
MSLLSAGSISLDSTFKVKNSYMIVNSNPTASQQNWKNHPGSKFFSFTNGVIDTNDQLTNISASLRKKFEIDLGKLISEKNLKLKISCQTPFEDRR